jgi:nicotinamide riboside kinase
MRIAITGPESAGKTTLAEQLAKETGFPLSTEFARQYVANLERPYALSDLIQIAEGQLAEDHRAANGADNLIADTELTTLKIWAEEKFSHCPLIIDLAWEAQQFDHYFLCKPDFPWEPDPQRENPDDRDRLFELYRKYLDQKKASYTILEGKPESRLAKAEEIIKYIP